MSTALVTPLPAVILRPSGDTTGATDAAQINAITQAGLWACLAGNATPFWINQSIQMASNARLTGAGIGASVIKAVNSFAPSQVGTNTGAVMLAAKGNTGQSHLTLGNLTFDMNQANIASVPGYADGPECSPISIWNAAEVEIAEVEVLNPVGYAIYLHVCTGAAVVAECRILTGAGSALGTNQQDGIHATECTRVIIENNDVDTGTGTAGDDAIAVQSLSTGSSAITITGNVIRAAQSGVHIALNGGNAANIAVAGNSVYAAKIDGITFDTSGSNTFACASVTGNTFQNIPNGINAAAGFKGLVIEGNALDSFTGSSQTGIYVVNGTGVVVKGNTLSNCSTLIKGIEIGDSGAGITGAAVTGNTVDMSAAGGGLVGILLRDTVTSTAAGNVVMGATVAASAGIRVDGATLAPVGNAITGNTVKGWATGILETNSGFAPNFNTIVGNNCHGNTAFITTVGANDVTASNVVA